MISRYCGSASIVATFLLFAAIVSARAQSPGPAQPANLQALVAAAEKEGSTVDVAWSIGMNGGDEGARHIEASVNKMFGTHLHINYSPLSVPGGAFESQVAQEVRAGQKPSTDILFNAHVAAIADYMIPVDWRKYVPQVPESIMFFGNRAVALTTLLEGITYNTKLIPPDEVPRSLADLLKPEWKGKIATSPYQGIEGSYLGLPEALGPDGMRKFYRAFADQLGGLIRCGANDRILSGEFPLLAIDCGDFEVRIAERKGVPLGTSYPKEGAGLYYFAPAIPATSPHPYGAQLVLAYLLTREGQDFLWDVMGTDNWKLPGSHMGQIIGEQQRMGVKFIEAFGADVDHPELADYEQEIDDLVNQSR
jgi:iron(III) transport system substrate-binding protein